MIIDIKYFLRSVKEHCIIKNRLSRHMKSFSIQIMFLKVTMVVFADFFEESYIFAVIMDPFQMSILAPYILNTTC